MLFTTAPESKLGQLSTVDIYLKFFNHLYTLSQYTHMPPNSPKLYIPRFSAGIDEVLNFPFLSLLDFLMCTYWIESCERMTVLDNSIPVVRMPESSSYYHVTIDERPETAQSRAMAAHSWGLCWVRAAAAAAGCAQRITTNSSFTSHHLSVRYQVSLHNSLSTCISKNEFNSCN